MHRPGSALVAVLLLVACGGEGQPPVTGPDAAPPDAGADAPVDAAPDAAPAAVLAFAQPTLELGEVISPASTRGTIELHNRGDAPATALVVAFEGTVDGGLRLDASGCGERLDPGASCPVTVHVVPTVAGQVTADLRASSASASEPARTRVIADAVVELTVARTGPGRVTATVPGFGLAIDCGETCRAPYHRSPAILHARPLDGAYFDGFTGACTGHVCTTAVTPGVQVEARFPLPAARRRWDDRPRLSPRAVAASPDGGLVVAGPELRAGWFPPTDGVVVSLAPDGAPRWTHVYTHEETAAHARDERFDDIYVNDVAVDAEDNTLVAGTVCISGESCRECSTSCVAWLRKLSPTGTPLWTWEAPALHTGLVGDMRESVEVDADGNIYLATSRGDLFSSDLWVRALDGDGDLRWQATHDGVSYQGRDGHDYAWDLAVADDGGVWVLARIATGQLDGDNHATRAPWLARYDRTGARTWSTTLTGAHRLAPAPGGGVYVLVADPFGVAKVQRWASDGTLTWTAQHGFEAPPMGTATTGGTALARLPDGGVVVTSTVHWSAFSENWSEVGLVGIDPDGTVRWSRRQAKPGAPGLYTSWASAVACDPAGGIAITGTEATDTGGAASLGYLTRYAP